MNQLAKSSSLENVSNCQWNNHSKWKKITAADVTQAIGNVPIVKLKYRDFPDCVLLALMLRVQSLWERQQNHTR
ncbi:hypothetical protein [Fischerella thermalis]|uniref:hypothetical protein n=1 Tax=Fischerella thermalis TaxID=372787 RepID=UPI00307F337B